MIPAKMLAKGLTVKIERGMFELTNIRGLVDPCYTVCFMWLQHCSEVTADQLTAAAAEPGSAAPAAVSVKMGPVHAVRWDN